MFFFNEPTNTAPEFAELTPNRQPFPSLTLAKQFTQPLVFFAFTSKIQGCITRNVPVVDDQRSSHFVRTFLAKYNLTAVEDEKLVLVRIDFANARAA
jgi:hypothetical protein